MNYHSQLSSLNNFIFANIGIGLDMNYQIYVEYGTMRQIKLNMQETLSVNNCQGFSAPTDIDKAFTASNLTFI
jgi:hypothetical protein